MLRKRQYDFRIGPYIGRVEAGTVKRALEHISRIVKTGNVDFGTW